LYVNARSLHRRSAAAGQQETAGPQAQPPSPAPPGTDRGAALASAVRAAQDHRHVSRECCVPSRAAV